MLSAIPMQCPACRMPLAHDTPIHRVSLSRQQTSETIRYVCRICTEMPNGTWRQWRAPVACVGCGRPMVYDGNRAIPEIVACGPDCHRIVCAARARERRARRRTERRCAMCSVPFLPRRDDARFCSTRCRQRHWRHVGRAA
jgi:hypothetical protein